MRWILQKQGGTAKDVSIYIPIGSIRWVMGISESIGFTRDNFF